MSFRSWWRERLTRSRSAVVFAVTDPITADTFLRLHLQRANRSGRAVHLVARAGPLLDRVAHETGVHPHGLPLERNPHPLRDLQALVAALQFLRRVRPFAVHVGTPKAGLVVGLAALLTGVPKRVYVIHGLRYETSTGARAHVLRLLEMVSCRVATQVVAVSPSVRARALEDGLVRPRHVVVLGSGSIAGVDGGRFVERSAGAVFRREVGIPQDAVVALYVGRLAVDKGIEDLVAAWSLVAAEHPRAYLLVVGAQDEAQPLPPRVSTSLQQAPRVVCAGFLSDPAPAYMASDVAVMPSHREGLGTFLLEAAAAGLPSVATDVTGCRDAVVDGHSGVLVPVRRPDALAAAIAAMMMDAASRDAMGDRARHRVLKEFRPDDVVARYDALVTR